MHRFTSNKIERIPEKKEKMGVVPVCMALRSCSLGCPSCGGKLYLYSATSFAHVEMLMSRREREGVWASGAFILSTKRQPEFTCPFFFSISLSTCAHLLFFFFLLSFGWVVQLTVTRDCLLGGCVFILTCSFGTVLSCRNKENALIPV